MNSSQPKSWFTGTRIAVFIVSLFALVSTFLFYLNATYVTGTELRSSDWQIRRFTFRRDPFTNRQLTGIKYSTFTGNPAWSANAGDTASDLNPLISKHLRRSTGSENRWDLILISGSPVYKGPASILHSLLSTSDPQSNMFWVDWTKDHPSRAKIFWPIVQQLTLFGLYSELPPLFELATNDLDAAQLKSEMGPRIQAAIIKFCDNPDNAAVQRKAIQFALQFGPNDLLTLSANSNPDSEQQSESLGDDIPRQ